MGIGDTHGEEGLSKCGDRGEQHFIRMDGIVKERKDAECLTKELPPPRHNAIRHVMMVIPLSISISLSAMRHSLCPHPVHK